MTHNITDFDFEKQVVQSPGLVLVDFWSPRCGPCQRQGPVLESLAQRFGAGLKVVKLNVDQHQSWARRLGVSGIPALLFFRAGKIVDRHTGLASEAALAARVQALQKVA